MRIAILSTVLLFSLSAVAAADPPPRGRVRLSEPVYRGTGCPAGSVEVVLAADNRTMSILFQSFAAETEHGRRLRTRECTIAVPIEVPAGYMLTLVRVDYRGFASVPRGTKGMFSARYWMLGSSSRRTTTFPGGYDASFNVTHELAQRRPVRSSCGRRVELGAETRIVVEKRESRSPDDAMVVLDSADLRSGIELQLEWTACSQ